MLASLLRIILLTATLKILERGLDKGPIIDIFDNLRIPVTKNQRKPGNTPYYGANGIQDYVSGYTHDGEFVLIAEDGANDLQNYPVTYASGKIWVNNHAHVLAGVNSKADTRFLAYLLKKVDFAAVLVGGTRAKLNGKTLKNIEVTLPERLKEQQAIASALSDFDEHIDNLSELIEKKKAIRDGALEDLINGKTRLDGFRGDWNSCKINDVADFFDNLRIPVTKNQRMPGNTPYYGANGIQDYVSGYTHDGEFILIAEDGANDLLNYPVTYASGKIWVNNHAHVLAGIKSVADTKFLSYLLKKVDYTAVLVGGTRAKLNGKTLKNIEITLPESISEQQAIASILTVMDEEIESLLTEKAKMVQISEGAMDDLLTGRVHLKV